MGKYKTFWIQEVYSELMLIHIGTVISFVQREIRLKYNSEKYSYIFT